MKIGYNWLEGALLDWLIDTYSSLHIYIITFHIFYPLFFLTFTITSWLNLCIHSRTQLAFVAARVLHDRTDNCRCRTHASTTPKTQTCLHVAIKYAHHLTHITFSLSDVRILVETGAIKMFRNFQCRLRLRLRTCTWIDVR